MPKPPRRTGLDECFHYLGEIGALMFFARAALDPDVKGVDLLRWTLRLQNALLTHPAHGPLKRLTIAAPQISTWRKANPIDWTPPPSEQSLSLRMLVIEVVSDADVPDAERECEGYVLILFEPNTETLVHHFLKANREADVSSNWILYVLARADEEVRTRASALGAPKDSVSISIPDLTNTSYAKAYAEAAARLKAAIPTGHLTITWLGKQKATLTLHNAHIDEAALRAVVAPLRFETSQKLRNAFVRIARAFNADDSSASNRATWIALNPLKGDIDRKPGWADQIREAHIRMTATPTPKR